MSNQELAAFVLEFTKSVDKLQRIYAPQVLENDLHPPEAFDAYYREMDALYARFLTNRKRRCFYFGLSVPPTFSEFEGQPVCTVKQTGNRAQVTLLSQQGGLDFRFRLQNQGGTWKISSFQQRLRTYQWTYGCF